MSPKIEAALDAAWRSLAVTAAAILLALIIGGGAAGATDSPLHFYLYCKTQWFTVTLIQVIAPAIRSFIAAKGTPST